MVCPICGLECRPHSNPRACIAALRARLEGYRGGIMAAMEYVERLLNNPTDDGQPQITDPGERNYWTSVLEQMRRHWEAK
jgi:hypothetical protein